MIQFITVITAFAIGFFFGGAAQYRAGNDIEYPKLFVAAAAIAILGTATIFTSAVYK